MIEIKIKINGKIIASELEKVKATYFESAMIIRRLEEIKLEILNMNFEPIMEIHEEKND